VPWDGRALLCEQTGAVRVLKSGKLLRAPFVTLAVDSSWERGLIGIALDPHFADNGHISLCYVAFRPYVHHRISRFTARGDAAASGSEDVLFEGDDQAKLGPSASSGHQGGAIHFGRDGKPYAAIDDHTAREPAQSLSTIQGKLLRLNPKRIHRLWR
jgi:glucose/arabinose dehydrogenase